MKAHIVALSLCFSLILLWLTPGSAAPSIHENGSEASEGLETLPLHQQWSTGGEDDDIFFGTVSGIRCAEDGVIYVLDGQLSQLQAYSPDGEWLRTLSREGDGPGEVRNPGGLFIDRGGEICMLHGMAGQIVRIHPDGTPADAYKYSSEASAAGGLIILMRGEISGDGMILAGIRIFFGQSGGSGQQYFLSRCDAQGQELQTILEKMHPIDYSDFHLDELAMDFPWGRWAVDAEGCIYVAPERNTYRIDVYGPDGELQRVISREYESYARDEEAKRIANLVIEGVGAYHPVPLQGVTIEQTEPDINGMWIAPDGMLWVQTSRGDREKPEGAYSLYDIFTPDGVFLKQAALIADVDNKKDSLAMLEDGRFAVVTGILDAWLTQQAVDRSEADKEAADANPLEVLIYGLE